MKTEKLKFIIPDGYIVDKENSTEKELVYVKKDNRDITDRVNSLKDAIDWSQLLGHKPCNLLQHL